MKDHYYTLERHTPQVNSKVRIDGDIQVTSLFDHIIDFLLGCGWQKDTIEDEIVSRACLIESFDLPEQD